MKLLYRKAHTQYLSVLVCLLLIGIGAEGVVLCIGADGHIDVEPAFHEVCDGTVHFASAGHFRPVQKAQAHPDNKHCQPCVDIPVPVGCVEVFPLPNQVKPTPLPASLFIPLAAIGAEFSKDELTSEPSVTANPHLTFFRSIILLI